MTYSIPEFMELIRGLFRQSLRSASELNQTLGLQGWLIILTLAVTVMSYRSQKRASIREAIEQVDPRWTRYRIIRPNEISNWNEQVQLKAGLDHFGLFTRRSKIGIYSNEIGDRNTRIVQQSVPPYYLTLPVTNSEDYKSLEDRILDYPKIRWVKRDEAKLVIICSTVNPVECRQIVNFVLNQHDRTVDNQIHVSDYRPWMSTEF